MREYDKIIRELVNTVDVSPHSWVNKPSKGWRANTTIIGHVLEDWKSQKLPAHEAMGLIAHLAYGPVPERITQVSEADITYVKARAQLDPKDIKALAQLHIGFVRRMLTPLRVTQFPEILENPTTNGALIVQKRLGITFTNLQLRSGMLPMQRHRTALHEIAHYRQLFADPKLVEQGKTLSHLVEDELLEDDPLAHLVYASNILEQDAEAFVRELMPYMSHTLTSDGPEI